MQEGNGAAKKLGKVMYIVFANSSMSKACALSWLEVEEFVNQVYALAESGAEIGDKEILSIANELYTEMRRHKEIYTDFRYTTARRGMHQMQRALGIIQ